jgi:hypothetical protein
MHKSILFFSSALISLLMACSSGENKNMPSGSIDPALVNNPATASADSSGKDKNAPVFDFKDESHDFGIITEGEKVSYAFRFKNSGKADLIIRSATGSCGCTVPEFSKDPIAPGKEGVVNVTFNSEGKESKQNKTVTLVANTIPNTKVLTILADVKPGK